MTPLTRPLVLVFLAFLGGLLFGLRFGLAPLWPALAAALFALLPAVLGWNRDERKRLASSITLLLAFVLAGAAIGGGGSRAAAMDCRAHFPDRAPLRVEGVLAANARPAAGEARQPLLPVIVRRAWIAERALPGCTGALRVRLPRGDRMLAAGTVLRLQGEWSLVASPVLASRWPRDPRLAGSLLADSLEVLAGPSLFAGPLLLLRGRTEAHVLNLFPRYGDLADALLLGRRERLDPAIRDRFARAGLAHLLAISGMHVGLIAGMLLLVARLLARTFALPRRVPVIAAMAGVVGYLLMIGAPPSAVRAGIMIALATTGLLLQRPFDAVPVVAAAALVMLVHRPLTVLEPGFQLSFAGVLGILTIYGAAQRRLPERWRHQGWRPWIAKSVIVSAAAFIATAPIVVWHFGMVAPISVVTNLLAVPLLGLALAALVMAVLIEPLLPPVGQLAAGATEAFLFLLESFAAVAAAVPFGHLFASRPQAWVWAVGALALVAVLDAAARYRSSFRWAAAVGAMLVVLVAGPAVAGAAGAGRGSLEIHFLDVGQGDAVAVRTPGDRWVMVDAGPADERFDAGERRVLPFLRAQGVRRLEAMILSHPHLDHIGGAPAILRGMPVGALIEPGHVTGSPRYLETLRVAEERGVCWRAARSGRVLQLDGVRFELLWPDPETLDGTRDANEISAVVLIRFGDFAALLTGDAYAAQERILVERHGAGLRSQVVKAGHHGSYTSTSPLLLDTARPELVVISAGRRNRFGHPAPEVLRDVAARGIQVRRTDRDGTVSVVARARGEPRWYLSSE